MSRDAAASPDSADEGGSQAVPSPGGRAGSAYLVSPESGPGPGVLVLHSWWGLNRATKEIVEHLADSGFTALAPDLFAGRTLSDPVDPLEAAERLGAADPDKTAGLILASIVALRAHSADPEAPVGIVGFSMGASWALWAATRQPDSVGAVVAYYGHQDMDFEGLRAPVLCHFAAMDPLVSGNEATEMQAHLHLAGVAVEAVRHPGTRHFFAEAGVPVVDSDGAAGERGLTEEAAAVTAWNQTVAFLSDHLGGDGGA